MPGDTATSGGTTWYALNLSSNSTPTTANANWTALGGGGGSGATALSGLTDVTITTPSSGQVLEWNGGAWVNASVSAGGVTSVFGRTGAVVASAADYASYYGQLSAVNAWLSANTFASTVGISGALTVGSSGIFSGPLSASNFALSGLPDVSISSPSSGQVLEWNGTAWINTTLTFSTALSGLTDVTISSPSSGQVLEWNGSDWVNAAGGGGGFPNPMTTKGDIIIENATPAPDRLAIGNPSSVLMSISGLPSWQNVGVGISTLYSGAGAYVFTVPPNSTTLNILICGSAGGGGTGGSGTGTNPGGGGGGGIGGWMSLIVPSQLLPSSTLYVFLNTGANSYISIANDSGGLVSGNTLAYATFGLVGVNGTPTGAGNGGAGGATPLLTTAKLASLGVPTFNAGQAGGAGASTSTLNNVAPTYGFITPGSGGGRPLNLSPPSNYGATILAFGGNSTVITGQFGGAGALSAGGNGTRGNDGFVYSAGQLLFCGATGGGGGGYSAVLDGNGAPGGDATLSLACGGGGGGAGTTGGTGGAGGSPFCLIIST